MDLDLRSQLDSLDETPNSSTYDKALPDDSDGLARLRANGSVDRLKNAVLNERDMSVVDATARSTAEQHQADMDRWEKEIRYRQDLIDETPALGSQPIELMQGNLVYAQQQMEMSKALRDQARGLQQDQLSDFSAGFSHGMLGLAKNLGFALKQYGETANSEATAGIGAGVAELAGQSEQQDLPAGMGLSDIHGVGGFGRYAAQTAGGIVPYVAAGLVGGEVPLAAAFLVAGHGQMREALEGAGITDKASLAKGTFTYGSLLGALQLVVPWATMRGLSKPAAEAFTGTIADISARVAAGTLQMSIAQSLAMGLSKWAEIYGVTDTGGKPMDWAKLANELPEAMGQGLIAGAMFGGVGDAGKAVGGGYKLGKAGEAPDGKPGDGNGPDGALPGSDGAGPAGAGTDPTLQAAPERVAPSGPVEVPQDAVTKTKSELEQYLAQQDHPVPLAQDEVQQVAADVAKGMSVPEAAAKFGHEEAATQIKDHLETEGADFKIPDEGLHDIASRMAKGAPVDEAITSYAKDQYAAEAKKHEAGAEPATTASGAAAATESVVGGTASERGNQSAELGGQRIDTTGQAVSAEPGQNPSVVGTEGGGQAGAGQSTITPEHTAAFRDLLRGPTPRKQWAEKLGVDPGQLAELINQGKADGLLRVDRNGVVRRTAGVRTGEGVKSETVPNEGVLGASAPGFTHEQNLFRAAWDGSVQAIDDLVNRGFEGEAPAATRRAGSFAGEARQAFDRLIGNYKDIITAYAIGDRKAAATALEKAVGSAARLDQLSDTPAARLFTQYARSMARQHLGEIAASPTDPTAAIRQAAALPARAELDAAMSKDFAATRRQLKSAGNKDAIFALDWLERATQRLAAEIDAGGQHIAAVIPAVQRAAAALENLAPGSVSQLSTQHIKAAAARLEAARAAAPLALPSRIEGQDVALTPRAVAKVAELQAAVDKAVEGILPRDVRTEVVQNIALAKADREDQIHSERTGRAITKTPEFQRWFTDSKAIDTNGDPLLLYHATNAVFEQFRTAGSDTNMRVAGAWFSDSPGKASDIYGRQQGSAVIPVYLSIKNPADNAIVKAMRAGGKTPAEVRAALEAAGYDGVHLSRQSHDHWVAFHPEQIKSAFNRGTFDPNDPRISYSLRAFHASQADVEQFSAEHAGSGQGQKMQGPGLYFGSTEGVARYFGRLIAKQKGLLSATTRNILNQVDGDLGEAFKFIDSKKAIFREGGARDNLIRAEAELKNNVPGYIYDVSINTKNNSIIDGDKPIADQPLGKKIIKLIGDYSKTTAENESWKLDKIQDYNPLMNEQGEGIAPDKAAELNGQQALALLRLRGISNEEMVQAGIHGMLFTEGDLAAKGGKSYVIFDPALTKVEGRKDQLFSLRAVESDTLRSSESDTVQSDTEGGSREQLSRTSESAGGTRGAAAQGRGSRPSNADRAIGAAAGADPSEARILRQESATLRADGSPRPGRLGDKARGAETGSRDAEALQSIGTTEQFNAAGHTGLVTAANVRPHAELDKIGAPESEKRLATLTYRLYPEGTKLANAKRDVLQQLGKPEVWARVSQHLDGSWEVSNVQIGEGAGRKGLATQLYNAIEKDLGIRMSPSGLLTKDGLGYWQKRSPESVKWHQYSKHEGHYISPVRAKNRLDEIGKEIAAIHARPEKDSDRATDLAGAIAERKELVKLWLGLPPEARAAAKANEMFAARPEAGGVEALGKTDPHAQLISIGARAVENEAARTGKTPETVAAQTARHEALEFFKDKGIIAPKEWEALLSAARAEGWVNETSVRDAYTRLNKERMSPAELESLIEKEAIMEKYGQYEKGDYTPTGVIAKVFKRIKEFLDRLKNAIKGEGFHTWDDIFQKVDAGELKRRYDAIYGDNAFESMAPTGELFSARVAPNGEPEVPAGHIRLYRGEGGTMMGSTAGGRWFSTERVTAEKFAAGGGRVRYVDIPNNAEGWKYFIADANNPNTQFLTDNPAVINRVKDLPPAGVSTAPTEPPLRPGMVRVYHSGSIGEGQTGRWVTADRTYASNYRPDLPLHYLDLPEHDSRLFAGGYADQGPKQGFSTSFELKPDEAKNLREISRDQAAARAAPPPKSTIEDTFAELRTELGLKMPFAKKGETPTLRQQMIAIASAGDQVMALHGPKLVPFFDQHMETLSSFALPLSTNRTQEGFSRFFREFVLRPNDLRARHADVYNDFADGLDAEAPHFLEALDRLQEQGRARLADIRTARAATAAAGGSGGQKPPPAPPSGPTIGGYPLPKAFNNFANGWKRNFQPETISAKAMEADPLFARYKAATAQEKDMIIARGEELWDHWNKVPEAERLGFLRDVDTGTPQATPELAEIAWRYRQLLDQARRDEAVYGSKAGYVEDYLPRQYEDPEGVKKFIATKNASSGLGPKWFQKERHFDLLEEAMQAGYKLKTTNPEEIVANRLMAGADMRQRMELLRGLEKMGLARRVKDLEAQQAGSVDIGPDGLDPNSGFARAGWEAISAPNMEQWIIAPDVQALWGNAVKAQGLWGNDGLAGSIFRKFMAFKNVWVPLKLALSLFHPLHVLHINWTNNLARAFSQMRGGDFNGAFDSALRFMDARQGVGYDARMAWAKPKEERTGAENALIDLMTDGGFVPQLSEELRINARRSFQKALDDKSWKVLPYGVRRGIEKMSAWAFERWIPGLKAAAYIKEAQSLFERSPQLLDDNIQRRVALRAIAKSVDNRYGEMAYSTLFWNRTVRDSAVASFLSLGWNLGFAREFGGAALETATRQFYQGPAPRQTARAATNKRAYAFVYVATAAAINGVMNWMLSGESPTGWDFIFPRIGGKNPDGTPRRVTNMFFTREIPMAMKHIQEQDSVTKGIAEMIWNKTMFQPFVELAENRDYWGYELWDENSPAYKKAFQLSKHLVFDQLLPITTSGAGRAAEIGGSWLDKGVPLAFAGFGPAPAYAERTALENRIRKLYSTFVAPQKKPYAAEEADSAKREAKDALRMALQRGDAAGVAKARADARAAGANAKGLTQSRLTQPASTYLFGRLPPDVQRSVLQDASPEEVQQYRKFANAKIKKEFPAQVLTRRAAQPAQ